MSSNSSASRESRQTLPALTAKYLVVLQEPAAADLQNASSLNVAVSSAASGRRPQLQTTSSKKLSRFGAESQGLQPAEALPSAAQVASMMASRGDSFSSQASTGSGPRVTVDEGRSCQAVYTLPLKRTMCMLNKVLSWAKDLL